MDIPSRKNILSYFDSKLSEHGPNAKGVDWKNEESQILRFNQLLRCLTDDIRDASILDFGCGYGAFLKYLRTFGFQGSYTGFDISDAMLAAAKKIYFDAEGTVQWKSKLDDGARFDYVFASGIFNLRLDAPDEVWSQYIYNSLKTINGLASEGFAVNFLTSYSDADKKRPDLFYTDPLKMFDHCKIEFSRFVSLIHDYPLYEFTIFVKK